MRYTCGACSRFLTAIIRAYVDAVGIMPPDTQRIVVRAAVQVMQIRLLLRAGRPGSRVSDKWAAALATAACWVGNRIDPPALVSSVGTQSDDSEGQDPSAGEDGHPQATEELSAASCRYKTACRGIGIGSKMDLCNLQSQIKHGTCPGAVGGWEVLRVTVLTRSVEVSIHDTARHIGTDFSQYFRKGEPEYFLSTPLFAEALQKPKEDHNWIAVCWLDERSPHMGAGQSGKRMHLESQKGGSERAPVHTSLSIPEGFLDKLGQASAGEFKWNAERLGDSFAASCRWWATEGA